MQNLCNIPVIQVNYRNNPELFRCGVSFHWWDAESTSLHNHNFYEFFIITHGKTTHELNGVVSELSKGTLCMIRPEDCHQFRKLPGFDCIHMNLCITPERLQEICAALGTSLPELSSGGPATIALSSEDISFLLSRAEQIGLVHRAGTGSASVIVCELLSEVVSLVRKARLFSDLNYPDWFQGILEKIHSPEYLSCAAADIYRMGGFSPPVMIGYFKTYTGKTVTEYLRNVKLDYACEILCKTGLTSLEISTRLGYDSLSHFNRIFKQHTGFSPGQFRHEKTKKPDR